MDADVPGQGVVVRCGLEVCKERDGALQGGEFAGGDWGEASVVKCTVLLLAFIAPTSGTGIEREGCK